ncbi:membrane-spanning 4-domains subfamily A member 4D-like isoform X3 [Polypterus senegalus]|uniref:membrane-spanning 4-domains subfamily A member 4D-like isoform X3 n=1 Tax=Polypterus senegalus TaxID=55291 RepID=UPI00196248F1|nr:membrane-spanning 4-domains subfamily A member 4D-like isoform X3 [Polypterus senegalus]
MSTSYSTGNGKLVITQVVPQNNVQGPNATTTVPVQVATGTNFCSMPQKWQRFLKGEPKALGVVQIMIGLINICFGIVLAFPGSLAVFCAIPFWTSVMYIISGSLSICAADKMQPCQIKGALATNIISTIFSCIGIIVYSIDLGINPRFRQIYSNYSFQAIQGIKGILLIFTILEFWVSLFTSIYGCKATCGNPDQPVIIIQQNVDPSGIPVQIPQYNIPQQTTPITQPYDWPSNMYSFLRP